MSYATEHLQGLAFLNEPHLAETLIFIGRHPGCNKTTIYRQIARGPHMVKRLDMLVSMGLLTIQEPRVNVSILTLTSKGMRIAVHLEEIMREVDWRAEAVLSSESL